jgi:hypothetical protein
VHDSITAKVHSLRCPFCEVYELEPFGHKSVCCVSCGSFLSGALLETLQTIVELPDAVGRHACECGHPEMRRLPDDVYWCPACDSEVLPAWDQLAFPDDTTTSRRLLTRRSFGSGI